MGTLLFRYGIDILIFCFLIWLFISSGKTKAKKRTRIFFLIQRIVPFTFIVWLLFSIVIPAIWGPVSHHARYLPQFTEAHKLRLYWQVACIIPSIRGNDAKIQHSINEIAREYTMHPDLIRAVVRVESSNNQFALSGVGACGLMQVMPNTFYSLRGGNPFALKSNLSAGTNYLRQLYRQFDGNVELALAAYNIGPGMVARLGAVPPGGVRRYVDKVMWWYKNYRDGSTPP